jgi:ribonuclease-3
LLQEYLQGKRIALPVYTVVETRGAAHNQEFEVECAIPKLEISVHGTGRSRRAAEQSAAKQAFEAAQHAMHLGRRTRKKPTTAAATTVELAAPTDATTEKAISAPRQPPSTAASGTASAAAAVDPIWMPVV